MNTFERIAWAEKEEEIAISLINAKDAVDEEEAVIKHKVRRSVEMAVRFFKEITEESACDNVNEHLVIEMIKNLMNGIPLTYLYDEEDEWEELPSMFDKYRVFSNKRYSPLFKYISEDNGHAIFSDHLRAIISAIYLNTGDTLEYHGHIVDTLVDELVPIELPYEPEEGRYIFIGERFGVYVNNVDYSYTCITNMLDTKDGKGMKLKRYFRETEDGWEEITKEEYEKEREKWMREKEDNMERTQEETSQSE